ncbi:hypothetical protein [Flavobacterium suzhouense]|uniref:YD repeat-containing protein n=1 Tax=Flavobacterium suzhouense TaxID=1529638 RepID=A0ABW5NVQ0_9FLAO
MRKVFALAATALFIFTSCSSDDNTNVTTPQDNTLLKKTTYITEGEATITYNYTYNDNKIISINGSNGRNTIYTYTGDLITKSITTEGTLTIQNNIEYDNNNRKVSQIHLISQTELNYESGSKTLYTYNENGTITMTIYIGDLESQTTFDSTYTITQSEESLIQFDGDLGSYSNVFDNKKNPMKNVTGYNEFMKPESSSKNNLLFGYKKNDTSDYIFTYTYALSNYPITSTQKILTNGVYKTYYLEYFYE